MRNKSQFKTYSRNPPIVWPPGGTGTDNDPMKHLESMAREFENNGSDIYAVNILAGYSFGDTYHTGLSFSVISMGSRAIAEQILTELCDYAIENKDKGNICELLPLDSVLDSVKKNTGDNGPILLVEPSENIGGVAPGDGTEILRFFIKYKLKNTAVAIADFEAVQKISSIPLGEMAELHIGGKMNEQDKGPISCKPTLLKVTNGRFDLEHPNSHLASALGKHIDMGPSALVEYEGIYILLSSKPIPPFDLAQFRSIGIDPETLRAIGIKAAIGHKQAYDPIANDSFTVDTPGPCSSNLKLLPYRKIRRPIFPLDKI